MDREAWHAVIHGVARSWTWLNDWTELNISFVHLKIGLSTFLNLLVFKIYSGISSLSDICNASILSYPVTFFFNNQALTIYIVWYYFMKLKRRQNLPIVEEVKLLLTSSGWGSDRDWESTKRGFCGVSNILYFVWSDLDGVPLAYAFPKVSSVHLIFFYFATSQ